MQQIEEALALAEMNMKDIPEAVECRAAKDRILEQIALIKELVTATAESNQSALSRLVATCNRMGINAKYPSEIGAAKDKLSFLGEQSKAVVGLQNAIKSRDLESLTSALEFAIQLNVLGEELTTAKTLKTRLEEENMMLDRLRNAIKSANVNDIQSVLHEVEAKGISHELIGEARVVLDREGMIKQTKVPLHNTIITI